MDLAVRTDVLTPRDIAAHAKTKYYPKTKYHFHFGRVRPGGLRADDPQPACTTAQLLQHDLPHVVPKLLERRTPQIFESRRAHHEAEMGSKSHKGEVLPSQHHLAEEGAHN